MPHTLGGAAQDMRWIQLATLVTWFAASSCAAFAESVGPESVSAGCLGGFTGGGSGGIVKRDGTILRWSKATYRDTIKEEIVRSDLAEASSIFNQLEGMGFAEVSYGRHGNMTCSLTFNQGALSHTVSWEIGDPLAPGSVVTLALRIQRLAWPIDAQPRAAHQGDEADVE